MVGSDDSFQNGPVFSGDTSHRLHVWSTYLWLKSMVSMLWVCFHVMGCFNLSRLQTTRAAGDVWTAPLGGELEPLSVAPPPRRKPWKRRECHARQAQGKVQAKGRCCFFRGFLLKEKTCSWIFAGNFFGVYGWKFSLLHVFEIGEMKGALRNMASEAGFEMVLTLGRGDGESEIQQASLQLQVRRRCFLDIAICI